MGEGLDRAVALDDKYLLEGGDAFMTGVQALVRLPIEQARRDRRAGLRIGTMISGYPGSPLGGYDTELARAGALLAEHDVHHVRGVNEELAAAAVLGSQLLDVFPHSRFDGATGLWYGKSPGVDRAGDVFRHANFAGGGRHCGAVALAGDDPTAKSSTLPNASEWAFASWAMPVLAPATVPELLEMGMQAVALSRFAGLWVGFKVVTDLCDGGAVVALPGAWPEIVEPPAPEGRPFRKPNATIMLAPGSLELERSLYEERLPAAQAFARANSIDRVELRGGRDRIGLLAAGKTFTDLMQALADMGLGAEELGGLGVRILKLGMVHPLDPVTVREFAAGLERLVVVEEKRDLIEGQVRSILYDLAERPQVLGKRGPGGETLFRPDGELQPDAIVAALAPLLFGSEPLPEPLRRRLEELDAVRSREAVRVAPRLPNYCSGCPHSRSTRIVDDELVGGGIGCHGMAPLIDQEERQIVWETAMGAEGAPWLGAAPFVETEHIFQNVGDGTFFHSASQSLRQAVAAGADITFKILYNGHVAMTGGQRAAGGSDVPALTRYLEAEGVARTVVVAEDPGRYAGGEGIAANAAVRGREAYAETVRELRETRGVTVLLFDQQCAAEKRRERKRGRQEVPAKHVVINEAVCEGCGDCGAKSNCMSLQPVQTEMGRKTQIDQSSCNQDYSCLEGDCPSFLTVYSRQGAKGPSRPRLPELDPAGLPAPAVAGRPGEPYRIYLPGVGGTGVVTTNQVLAYAAHIEGKHVLGLDQTGLAQKGGAVISSLTVAAEPLGYRAHKVGIGQADLVIGLDLQGVAAAANLDRCLPGRTAVVGDLGRQPTAHEIRHVEAVPPRVERLREAIDARSDAGRNVWLDAGALAAELFGDQTKVNTFMVGVASQAGLLPISPESVEAAYRLNGVDVEGNLAAFRHGRLHVADPEALELRRAAAVAAVRPAGGEAPRASRRALAAAEPLLAQGAELDAESRRLLAIRVPELVDYQDAAYAGAFVADVLRVGRREREATGETGPLTQAAIRNLFKLMAYKDEYEVARLLTGEEWRRRVEAQFPGARVKFNLHPPLLRERGLARKLELGQWARPLLAGLARMRRLRGTRLDPFGRTELRRSERELVGWYRELLERLLAELRPGNLEAAVELAEAPDRIRGYEELKLRRIAEAKAFVAEREGDLRAMERTA